MPSRTVPERALSDARGMGIDSTVGAVAASGRRASLTKRVRVTALFAVVVIADQSTKSVAQRIREVFAFDPGQNSEYALGLATAHPVVLAMGTVLAIVFAVVWSRRAPVEPAWWVAPAFVGGAFGNLADRIALGAVRDFIATPWFVYHLADVAIGAALAGFYISVIRWRRVRPIGRG